MTKGPILIDLDDDADAPSPATAPPVPDPEAPPHPKGRAMQTLATLAARKPSTLARLFWGLLLAIITAVVSVAAWDFITGLITRAPLLGYAVTGLTAAFVLVLLIIALRELAAISRLARIDRLQSRAEAALSADSLGDARAVVDAAVTEQGLILVNSSRSILYASSGDDFADAAAGVAAELQGVLG